MRNAQHMLKAHYEEAKNFYFMFATENRKRFLDKLKTVMWVEIALLSAVGFLIREFGVNAGLLIAIVLLFVNMLFLLKEFLKPIETNVPDLDKGIDWIYELVREEKDQGEVEDKAMERFYISKIKSFAERIDREHENVRRNERKYKRFLVVTAIQFLLVAMTIFTGGG